jgi:hypothetical protein
MNQYYYANEDGTEYRAPRWWLGYLVGIVMIVLGIVVPCGGIGIMAFSAIPKSDQTLKPPGKFTVPVEEAGEMVIWVDERDDTLSGSEPVVPADFAATVTGPGATPIATRQPTETLTSSTMDTSRTGAATFIAPAAGSYTVDVKGTFKAGQTIAVTPDSQHRDMALGLGAIVMLLLGLLLVGGGITVLVVTGVRHSKHGRE